MGWVLTPKVGKGKFDICRECEHTDCAANRALIATACVDCGKALGQRRPYYSVEGGYAHAGCRWKQS